MNAITTIGNWSGEVGTPLENAIRVTMRVMRRSSRDTTKQAIILMAQSARAMTPQAKRKRRVDPNPHFRHLLKDKQYNDLEKREDVIRPYFKFTALKYRQPPANHNPIYGNTRKELSNVPRVGFAKASWFWGLRKLGARSGATRFRDITNAVTAGEWTTVRNEIGHYMNNALSYILAILPANWRQEVERKAGNRMMAQAKKRLEVDMAREMKRAGRGGRA